MIAKKIIIFWFICISYLTYQFAFVEWYEWQVSLTIKAWYLNIIGTWYVNIWTINNQPTTGEIIISTTNTLQIKDLRTSCTGHYTTIQISNINNWSDYISNNNIYFRANSWNIIMWLDNPFSIFWSQISNTRSTAKTPITYIKRENNQWCGIVGQYWENWEIKITVPANQTAGTYRWKIYYLLIEN